MRHDIDAAGDTAVCTDSRPDAEPPGCSRYWAVVQTYPQAERWAEANLRRRGYETFLPTFTTLVADRATPTLQHGVERPLFTGYLFVSVSGPWTPIRYCPGVARLLMQGGKPNMVPDGAVSVLQAGEGVRRCPTPREGLQRPGAACRIVYGPCQGMEAVVVKAEGRKVTILVAMLGGLRKARVEARALVAR